MKHNPEYFNLKTPKLVPVDEFIDKVLYKPNFGYYTKKIPFGSKGDFVTSPTISNLFSSLRERLQKHAATSRRISTSSEVRRLERGVNAPS